jgi:hypothetical protein
VKRGSIEIEAEALPEGAPVTILVPEDGETFEVDPSDEAKLLAAIAEAERGEAVSSSELLSQIRKS